MLFGKLFWQKKDRITWWVLPADAHVQNTFQPPAVLANGHSLYMSKSSASAP